MSYSLNPNRPNVFFKKASVSKISDFEFSRVYNTFIILAHPYESRHEIFNNVECAISKGSNQPVHMGSLIRAFASRLNTQ